MAGKGAAYWVVAGVLGSGYVKGGRGGQAPWGIWGGRENLRRSEVTQRGWLIKMLEMEVEIRGGVGYGKRQHGKAEGC